MSTTKKYDHVSLVETCYDLEGSDQQWARRLLESASVVLDNGFGLGLQLLREREDGMGVEVVLGDGTGTGRIAVLASRPFVERLAGDTYRRYMHPPHPVALATPILTQLPKAIQLGHQALRSMCGCQDALGLLCYPAPGWIIPVMIGIGKNHQITSQFRHAMHRLRVHIESGARLRLLRPENAIAVLSPDGRVAHLASGSGSEPMRDRLAHQVRAIEHVRTRDERSKDDALSLWSALVEGRWSLSEHVDRDGKRLYYVFENTPRARAYRALTASESTVLDQSIKGLPAKVIAYATGLPPSRASEYLDSAATKLGFRNRVELLRMASELRANGQLNLLDYELTTAEEEVLMLVREGLSNREIAERRNKSERTIANQVASVLRKTGMPGRKALIVAADRATNRTH